MAKIDLKKLVDEMNTRIVSITREEHGEIEKEVQAEVAYSERIIAQLKRGEYAC
jgi:hypothetical protein